MFAGMAILAAHAISHPSFGHPICAAHQVSVVTSVSVLAVLAYHVYARYRQRMSSANPPAKRIKFLRGLAEATDFDDGAFDLVVFSFVIHECPQVRGTCRSACLEGRDASRADGWC